MSGVAIWWAGRAPELAVLTASGSKSLPGLLGIEFVAVGDDWIAATMPVDARTHQPWGRLHGGASVVLAETVATFAACSTLDQKRFIAVGMEINANHVRPAFEGLVSATAKPEALGRTSQVWTIRVEDKQQRLICIARMTAAVIALDRN